METSIADLIDFLWKSISSGVIGNATYDMIKKTLGNGFERLQFMAKNNERNEFNAAILAITDMNSLILEKLQNIFDKSCGAIGSSETNNQNVTGSGNFVQSGNGNLAQSGNGNSQTNIYNNIKMYDEDNLDVSIMSADALKLFHPKNIEFDKPVIVVIVKNIGKRRVCVDEIIVQYRDGTIGNCLNIESNLIDIGQVSNWFIANGHPMTVSTGEVVHNIGVVRILEIDRELIESISVKTTSGKLFKVNRVNWKGVA